MGRKQKYITLEQKKEAQREWSRVYYEKNKLKIDEQAKQRYREKNRNL
jgi:hypothetical protein